MKIKALPFTMLFTVLFFVSCAAGQNERPGDTVSASDSIRVDTVVEIKKVLPEDVIIEKEFLYDKYTLEDSYPYKDTVRVFQWDSIRTHLATLMTLQQEPQRWGILKNRRNENGEAPLVKVYARNDYKRIADPWGVERYQGVPLYAPDDEETPVRYTFDGTLVRLLGPDTVDMVQVSPVYFGGDWTVPKRYLKTIDTEQFTKVVVVDRNNQNITTLEEVEGKWKVRSMNPATTGQRKPPYAQETPLGIFVVMEKKPKMIFLKDGTTETGGFAPHATRFSGGGYIHGVPINAPATATVEYSQTLGTTPRSHKCVRNATSHAKYVYDWAPVEESLVIVIE